MRTIALAVAILAAAMAGPAIATAAAAPVGGWSPAGNLSTVRPGPIFAMTLTDGRVLVTGASSSDYSGIGNVDIFDPARGWTLGPKLNGDPVTAVAAPLPGGGALVAAGTPWYGGFDGPGPDPTAKTMTYDPASSTWQSAPDMSRRRNSAAAVALNDGRVLVTGGYDRKVTQLPNPDQKPFCCLQIDVIPLASTEIFDAKTRTWSLAGDIAHPRYGQSAITLKGGDVLVLGGQDRQQTLGTPAPMTSAELFNPSTGKWTSAGDIGTARSGYTLTALGDGRALLAGGLAPDGFTLLRSTLLYDPVQNTWSPGPAMNEARTQHAAAALKDGRVLVAGGVDYRGRVASAEILDPATSTWTETGALGVARSDAAAVALHDGRVLVVGGHGSAGYLGDSELFDPAAIAAAPVPATNGAGTWLVRPRLAVTSSSQDVQVLNDGRVLVVPKDSSDFVAEIYDPKTATWSTAFTRKSDQQSFTAVALADHRVLMLALDGQGLLPGTAEIVDPLTGTSVAAASPGTLRSAILHLLPDRRVWLTDAVGMDKRSFFYDPSADRWSQGPDIPDNMLVANVTWIPGGRVVVGGTLGLMILDPAKSALYPAWSFPDRWYDYSATSLPNGDVLLAGGLVDQNQQNRTIQVAVTRVMRWNNGTGKLEKARDMTAPRPNHSTVVLRDGRVLFAGGVAGADEGADPVTTVEIYDPGRDTWSPAASMPVARSQMSAVLLRDGSVLEVGGFGLFNGEDTLEYSPPSGKAAPSTAASSLRTVASLSGPSWIRPLLIVVAVLVAGALIAAVTVASARRRRT